MSARFIQLHTLTSYPAALLNRDDAGFAKRMPFGGTTRIRISSQCLKRHWRTFEGEHALKELDVPGSVRSRLSFDQLVLQPLVKEGISEPLAMAVTKALMEEVLGKNEKKEAATEAKKKKKESLPDGGDAGAEAEIQSVHTKQLTVLGRPELAYLARLALEICRAEADPKKAAAAAKEKLGREGRKNLGAMKNASGLDAALFGRMVTGDVLARGDAAVHVAHALTVHEQAQETDYFTAVDDLQRLGEEDQLGSAHINTQELTSGLYYGYVVVDVPLLVSNLEGCEATEWEKADRTLASKVVEHLVYLAATVTPGAKLGSTAPYSKAHLVLAEAGDAQPCSLANAFLKAVPQSDLVADTYKALGRYEAVPIWWTPGYAARTARTDAS